MMINLQNPQTNIKTQSTKILIKSTQQILFSLLEYDLKKSQILGHQ